MSEIKLVGHGGVEPPLLDSKSSVLPLYECPIENLVGALGNDPSSAS